MDWDHFWAWTGDPAVWDWVRTGAAALVGALIGGVFTFFGQSRQAKAQRDLQADQIAGAAVADQARWEREQQEAALTHSLDSAHELLEGFIAVQRAIYSATPSLGDYVSGASWKPQWKSIWTEEVSLDLDVRARLIAEEKVSLQVKRLVRLLDAAESVAREASGSTAPHVTMRLREIALHLTAEGIEVVAAYIRRRPYVTSRTDLLNWLDQVRQDYEEWEEREMARAEDHDNYEPQDAPIPDDGTQQA